MVILNIKGWSNEWYLLDWKKIGKLMGLVSMFYCEDH